MIALDQIEFQRLDDSEGDKNRGWQIDEVRCQAGDLLVGYLKLGYIPADRFKEHFKDGILSYLSSIKGQVFIPRSHHEQALPEISSLEQDELVRYVMNLYWSVLHKDFSMDAEFKNKSRSELLRMVTEALVQIPKKTYQDFESFKDFHINKPVVDYIFVDEKFRRQGIATMLYTIGSRWMAEKGMMLHASSLQQAEAAAAWSKMKCMGMTAMIGNRMVLKAKTCNA
jgi:GNAT superfamily N-acetyltransferase